MNITWRELSECERRIDRGYSLAFRSAILFCRPRLLHLRLLLSPAEVSTIVTDDRRRRHPQHRGFFARVWPSQPRLSVPYGMALLCASSLSIRSYLLIPGGSQRLPPWASPARYFDAAPEVGQSVYTSRLSAYIPAGCCRSCCSIASRRTATAHDVSIEGHPGSVYDQLLTSAQGTPQLPSLEQSPEHISRSISRWELSNQCAYRSSHDRPSPVDNYTEAGPLSRSPIQTPAHCGTRLRSCMPVLYWTRPQ